VKTVLAIVALFIATSAVEASTRITHNYYGVAPVRTYRIYSVPVVTAPVVAAPAPAVEEVSQPAPAAVVPVYSYSVPVVVRSPAVVTKKTKVEHHRHHHKTTTTTTVRH
jgi:hypothetical protein